MARVTDLAILFLTAGYFGTFNATVHGNTLPPTPESACEAIAAVLPGEAVSPKKVKSTDLWSYKGDLDPVKLNKKLRGPLAGKADLINSVAKKYDIDVAWFMAIIANESGWGKHHINRYNFGGLKGRVKGWQSFSTPEEGLNAVASLLARRYKNMSLKRMHTVYGGGTRGWHSQVSVHYNNLKGYVN